MPASVYCETVFDKLYKNFIVKIIKENKKVEEQLRRKLHNFDTLYGSEEIELDMNRILTIRWIKIPTFIENNLPKYYVVFFVDVEWWRAGELSLIWKECIECSGFKSKKIDDSYTVYLVGKLEGLIKSVNRKAKEMHIFRINKIINELTDKDEKNILDWMGNFLDRRCMDLNKKNEKKEIFGSVEKDIKRISEFVEYIQNIKKIKDTSPNDLGVIIKET